MIILKVIAAVIAAIVGYIIFENALARFTPDWIAATIAIIAALTLGYLIVK